MLKAPYMEKFYSYNSKYIHNALALRDPQHDSLEIFARLCDVLSLRKNPMTTEQICADHAAELDACPTNDKHQALIEKLPYTNIFRAGLSVCLLCAGNRHRKNPLDGCLYCIPALRKRNQQLLRHGSQFDHL